MAFIINQDKNVIAFPDVEQLIYKGESKNQKIRLPKLNELDNPLCGLAFNAIKEAGIKGAAIKKRVVKSEKGKLSQGQDPAFALFESEGEKYHTMFTRVEASTISWMIGVYIPEKNLLALALGLAPALFYLGSKCGN